MVQVRLSFFISVLADSLFVPLCDTNVTPSNKSIGMCALSHFLARVLVLTNLELCSSAEDSGPVSVDVFMAVCVYRCVVVAVFVSVCGCVSPCVYLSM